MTTHTNSSTVNPPARKKTAPTTTDSSRPNLSTRARTLRQTWSPSPSASTPRPNLSPSALSSLSISHKEFNTHAHVSPRDGRVHISVNALKENGPLSNIIPTLNAAELAGVIEHEKKHNGDDVSPAPPRLNIVVMVIGSRGDVQPFIAIAKVLKEQWGHRVRLATHGAFRDFVEGHGIEFFEVGGDPGELMAFMVKNPGLIPNVETIKAGEIAKRREQMFEMFLGFWKSCIEPCDGYTRRKNRKARRNSSDSSGATTNEETSDEEGREHHDEREEDTEPFVADAIIANPPSFAHVHCAEKLGVPLHLMFTFPYSPTQEIAHPLAFIQNSNLGSEYTNAITYPMVEMMTWQGLGDLVNRFREKTLFLEPVATLWAPGMISRLKVPYTYMWSPALIPKPADWGQHIEITGFVFLDQTKDYKPPDELTKFLNAGPPPIYIGFGSIVVDDPDALTNMIFGAVKSTGVRALVSKGWGGLGGEMAVPENVYMLGNTPHDWLFDKVEAVIHHGGAGTTAIGLKMGRPTLVVPFFGDQPFWGAMIYNSGAGAEPVPHKELTEEKLANAIRVLLKDETKEKAAGISRRIQEDDGNGAENAVRSFYKSLQELDSKGKRGLGYRGKVHGEGGPMGPGEGKWGAGGPGICCDVLEEKVAVWRVRGTRVRLSAMAASWYIRNQRLTWEDLRLVRHTEWNDFDGPGEPLSGGFSAVFSSIAGVAKGFLGVPYTFFKGAKRVDNEVDLATELAPATTKARLQRRFRSSTSNSWTDTASALSGSCPTSPSRSRSLTRSPRSRSLTRSPHSRSRSRHISKSPAPPRHHKHRHIGRDIRRGTRSSLKKILRSTAHAPLDVSLAVAQGFHNAPRLYGDDVRRPARITGFHSGARAAGKELALGIYDGVTGLVVQPYRGARKEGVVGALKGVGKGFGGAILKTQAGFTGVIGFGLKGVHREMRKGRDRKVLARVMEARRRQGGRELESVIAAAAEEAVAATATESQTKGGDGKEIQRLTSPERKQVEEQGIEVLKERMELGWKGIVEEREQRKNKDKDKGIARLRRLRKERSEQARNDADLESEAGAGQEGVLGGRLGERERREMRRRIRRGMTA